MGQMAFFFASVYVSAPVARDGVQILLAYHVVVEAG